MRLLVIATLLATTSLTPTAHADVQCAKPTIDRPRIGLVLGGGGARGIAHIGVIRMLEELRVPVDYVAGTSMGALVGGMYATGMTADELERVVEDIDWQDIFADGGARADRPFRRKRDDDLSLFGPKFGVGPRSSLLPRGAIHGQKISFLFQTITSARVQTKNFDTLPIPFRAVAADVVTGRPVVMSDGDLATAMRASMSIPGLFSPVDRDDFLLVDGGIAKNLPVDVARSMGADIIIAVDVGTPLEPKDALRDVIAITTQLTTLLVERNTQEQRALLTSSDLLIVPQLGYDITSGGFDKATREAIPIGYEAAARSRLALEALAVSDAEYMTHRAAINDCVSGPPTIEFVDIDNRSRFRDAIVEERIHVRIGAPLDPKRIEKDITQIFGLGFLETAGYEVVEKDGRDGVRITVKQDPRGTGFIETGVDFAGDSDSSSIDIRLAYLKTDIDDLGSEFRTLAQVGENQALLAELYKPLDQDLTVILLPRIFAERQTISTFDAGGNKSAQVQIQQIGASMALGKEFWRHAALFVGVRRYAGDTEVEVGAPQPNDDFEGGEYFTDLSWDRLDDRYFPSAGSFLRAEYTTSRDELGASEVYEQLNTSALTAASVGRHTLLAGARYGTTFSGDSPVQSLFRAGGLFRLSGFQPDEVSGSHFGMAFAGYRLRLFQQGFLPSYIGATVEYGNASEQRDDVWDEALFNGSAYLGFRSPLGPLYAGYGFAEGGRRAYFLRIGTVLGPTAVGR